MSSAKHFSFVKREILFLNLFFTTNLLHEKLVLFDILVVWPMSQSKKQKYDFPCKTKINANSYCKKDVKASVK